MPCATRFEGVLANACLEYISRNGFDKITPRKWDSPESPRLPRVSVKVERGEEAVYRTGIYKARIVIMAFVKPKDKRWTSEEIIGDIEELLVTDLLAHEKVTNHNVHIFAFEGGGVESKTEGDKRLSTLKVAAVAFLKT